MKAIEISNGAIIGIDKFGVTILNKENKTPTQQCLSWEDIYITILKRRDNES